MCVRTENVFTKQLLSCTRRGMKYKHRMTVSYLSILLNMSFCVQRINTSAGLRLVHDAGSKLLIYAFMKQAHYNAWDNRKTQDA